MGQRSYSSRVNRVLAVIGGLRPCMPKSALVTVYDSAMRGVLAPIQVLSAYLPQKVSWTDFMPPATQLALLSSRAATASLIQSGGSTMSLSIRAIRSPVVFLTPASRLELASRSPGGGSTPTIVSLGSARPARPPQVRSPGEPTRTI